MTRPVSANHPHRAARLTGWRRFAIAMLAALLAALVSGEPSLAQGSPDEELAAAAAAERSGRSEDAARHYEKFLSAGAPSPASHTVIEARTRLATVYFLLHRYRESLRALAGVPFDAGERSVPAQAWLVRGLAYLELNQLPDAVRSLRQTLVMNPDSGTARLALGDAEARSGHFEDAAAVYREQLRRTPKVADAWYKLGLVYTQLTQELSADFAREQANTALAAQLAAEQLADRGDYWGAAQALFPAVHPSRQDSDQKTSNPPPAKTPPPAPAAAFQPGLHGDFGTAVLELGYPSAAEQEFRAELSRDPESLPALLGMAEVQALRSNWDQALDIVGRLMALYPTELARRLESAPPAPVSEAWKQGRIALPTRLAESAAAKLLTLWLQSGGLASPPRLESTRAECSSQPANREPGYWIPENCAAQLRRELTSRQSLSEGEAAKLVETEYRLGDYQQSGDRASALARSAPNSPWAAYWLVKSYSALAGQCFDQLSKLGPNSARVYQILARYHSERHQLPAARAEYLAALRLAPELPDLHLGLGTVCWQAGDWEQAEAELRKTLTLSPGSAVAAYEMGDSYIQQHRWPQAMDYLPRALTDPAVERQARLDLAKAEAELGQYPAAIRDLVRLADGDRDGEVHYRLAMLYRKTGDTAKAQEALTQSEALRKASDQLGRQQLEALERQRGNLQDFDHTPPQ